MKKTFTEEELKEFLSKIIQESFGYKLEAVAESLLGGKILEEENKFTWYPNIEED